ncbi:hypothetical protein LSTR_LSTR012946 [Laodelphax striatellus]|uniref:Uncharacterized protein n=1 Tax=Laodelphax striatellus TaxID=195883 RepID=A0A482X086_LAOST|nr:hypothetical protein LSTR_LSTR012946 [Laodelphax striatellus]
MKCWCVITYCYQLFVIEQLKDKKMRCFKLQQKFVEWKYKLKRQKHTRAHQRERSMTISNIFKKCLVKTLRPTLNTAITRTIIVLSKTKDYCPKRKTNPHVLGANAETLV